MAMNDDLTLRRTPLHGETGHTHIEGDESHYLGDHECNGLSCAHEHSFHGERAFDAGTATDLDRTRVLELRAEELTAYKQRRQAGEVEVGKRVVAEQRSIDVPVTREEVVIERHPVAPRPADRIGAADAEETLRVPLMEERVVAEKRPVVTEEISVGKRVVQETQRVSGTVRHEEAVVEHDPGVEVEHRQAGLPHGDVE